MPLGLPCTDLVRILRYYIVLLTECTLHLISWYLQTLIILIISKFTIFLSKKNRQRGPSYLTIGNLINPRDLFSSRFAGNHSSNSRSYKRSESNWGPRGWYVSDGVHKFPGVKRYGTYPERTSRALHCSEYLCSIHPKMLLPIAVFNLATWQLQQPLQVFAGIALFEQRSVNPSSGSVKP